MIGNTKRARAAETEYVPPDWRRPSRRGGKGGIRELIVASLYRGLTKPWGRARTVPYIRMSGAWLEAAGFRHGDRIEVTAERDRLVLTVVRNERERRIN